MLWSPCAELAVESAALSFADFAFPCWLACTRVLHDPVEWGVWRCSGAFSLGSHQTENPFTISAECHVSLPVPVSVIDCRPLELVTVTYSRLSPPKNRARNIVDV